MFDNKALLSDMLRNPLSIQQNVLDELQSRSNGEHVIADSNSPFCNLLEASSSISAACMQEIDNVVIPGIYATQAQTFKSLSRHMSDYDYVNIFSTPSHTTLVMQLDLITLNDKAIDFNTHYKKAVIPEDAVFKVGNYNFGIYYPIEIQINKINGDILVINDVSKEHPLHKVMVNILESQKHTINGLPMMSFSFPAYQFAKSYDITDAIGVSGFCKSYTYNNKFYACRIYSFNPKNKTWTEMSQTTSDIIYDTGTLTAKISVEPDINKFTVTIPQVYFTNNLMGTKVMVELYTTYGALDLDISSYSVDAFNFSFDNNTKNITKYSDILKKNPSLRILPRDTTITGGSDGVTFEVAKQRVVDTITHRSLLISPADMTAYFADDGFKVTKHIDNISNRIYFCNGKLKDKDGSFVPVTNTATKITADIVASCSDIKPNQSTSVTILPTAIYQFDKSTNSTSILSDVDKKILTDKTTEEYVNTLNSYTYTKSPFHVVVDLPPARYNTATSYNLFTTSVKSIQFKYDNNQIMAQMAAYAATINHDGNGSGGYTIRFIVSKTDDLKQVDENDLKVIVRVKDMLGTWAGLDATYIAQQDEYYIYEIHLDTDYRLENGTINFTNINVNGDNIGHQISLETDWHVSYCIASSMVPGVTNDANIMVGISDTISSKYIGMGRQLFTLHLGHSLDDVIYNICDANWSKQEYKTYEYNEYQTYDSDVYDTNADGSLKTQIVDGKVVLSKLHSAGDNVLDTNGKPIIKHAIGDIIYDATGNPTVETSRNYEYLITMMHVDARMFASQDATHANFVTTLPTTLESYFTTITAAKAKILEETKLYYRPVRTIGTGNFSIGDNVTAIQDLNMSFRMKLHVPAFVKNNTDYQVLIKNTIVKITEKYMVTEKFSMTDIANEIKEVLANYVDAVDVLGINGDKELQTIQVMDDDAIPSVSRKLTILKDGTLSLEKDINIELVATSTTLST